MYSQCWITYVHDFFQRNELHVPFFLSKVYIDSNANTGHPRCRERVLPYETQAHNIKVHTVLQCKRIVIFTVYVRPEGVGWIRFG